MRDARAQRAGCAVTRAETLSEYDVSSFGEIVTLGKFERAPVFAPHFYECMLEGDGAHEGRGRWRIEVLPEDRAEFPELGCAQSVLIWESDDGFVNCVACGE